MAITPGDDVTIANEPLPRGPLVESGGQLSRSFFNWFQGKDRKLGEIISGVNLNRQNIVQLQTDYQAADGAISSAYIAADAVVAADAESARATLETVLTVRAGGIEDGIVKNSRFQQPFTGTAVPPQWTSWDNGVGTFETRVVGTGYAFSVTGLAATNHGIRQTVTVFAGKKYLLSGEIRRTGGTLAGAGLLVQWLDGSAAVISSSSIVFATEAQTDGSTGASPDGVARWEKEVTAPTGAVSAIVYAMAHYAAFGSIASENSFFWREADLRLVSFAQAQVTNIAEAYATNNASTARLVWSVNTATNVATIEQTAHEGYSDGTWNGSAIKLAADLLELLAKDINFGTNTSFEDTYGTIYTEKNSKRMRILGPFPASDDIVMWFGPTSVALNSETKTNGHFSMATDGKVYLGSAALSSPITISRTNGFVKTRIGAGTITSDSVSFSSTGGSGTGYTYAHELFSSYSTGPTATLSSASGSPITISATGAVPGDEIRGFVQTTVTDSDGNKATLLSPVALFCES